MSAQHPAEPVHHVHRLLPPRDQEVTLPNNGTLHSRAHNDLGQGGVALALPSSGDRYLSLALVDARRGLRHGPIYCGTADARIGLAGVASEEVEQLAARQLAAEYRSADLVVTVCVKTFLAISRSIVVTSDMDAFLK